MHRKPLLDLIDRYARRFPEEELETNRYRRFVEDNTDCFERSLEIGHITGAAWLVDAEGERVLFTHHAKLDIWVQLGGHAEGNNDVLAVAMMEAHEESGLSDIVPISTEIFDLDIHPIPQWKNVPAHFHYDARFALKHTGDGNFTVSSESKDLAWIEIDKIQDVTQEESILRMARKWRDLKDDGF